VAGRLHRKALDIGSNKRYAEQIDQKMTTHVGLMVLRETPDTLGDREPERDVLPLVRAANPVFAGARLRYGRVAVMLDVAHRRD